MRRALRSVTVAQLQRRTAGDASWARFANEWKTLTQSDAVPYIGVGAVRAEPGRATIPRWRARDVRRLRDTLAWATPIATKSSTSCRRRPTCRRTMPRSTSAYWNDMNRVAFEPADIATLRRQHPVFAETGLVKGELKEDLLLASLASRPRRSQVGTPVRSPAFSFRFPSPKRNHHDPNHASAGARRTRHPGRTACASSKTSPYRRPTKATW